MNFPEVVLPRAPKTARICIANSNVPNMVGQISTVLAGASLNIAELLNKSRGEYAYTLIDTDGAVDAGVIDKIRGDRRRAGGAGDINRGHGKAQSSRAKQKTQQAAGPVARRRSDPLAQLRAQIDSVDARIHALLNERARLARQVGISKHADGHTVDFYRPEREAQVLRMARERNKGPLRTEEILRLFREIMSACLAQEEPLKVGYLGPEGTFSQTATLKHFGHSVRALALSSVDEVFHEVEAGLADFGVVPVENSTEGIGQPHARQLVRFAAEDLRRGRAAHPPVPDGRRWTRWRRSSASAAIRSRWRNAAAGWTSICRTCRACRCPATPRARAARATRRARPPSPAKPRPMSTDSSRWPPRSKIATTTPRAFL